MWILNNSWIVRAKFDYQWMKFSSSGFSIIVNNKWLSLFLCFCFLLSFCLIFHDKYYKINIILTILFELKNETFFRYQIFQNWNWDPKKLEKSWNREVLKPKYHTLIVSFIGFVLYLASELYLIDIIFIIILILNIYSWLIDK